MRFVLSRLGACVTLLCLVSGCAQQPPARVELRGGGQFARAPQETAMAQQAVPVDPVQVVEVHNISSVPPAVEARALVPQSASRAQPVTSHVAMDAVPSNPWTRKARDAGSFAPVKPATRAVLESSYIWPVDSHNITASFGKQGRGKVNDGITIAAAHGEPVWAAAAGEVIYADQKMSGYGKMVIIKHTGGKTTTYAHLSRYSVEKYDRVKQGDIIGYVGDTGRAKASQLYFSMRQGTKPLDPRRYLGRDVAGL